MVRNILIIVVAVVILIVAAGIGGCRKQADKPSADNGKISDELIIFHAGSLSVPFREVSELFANEYPDVTVKAEAAGSRRCARQICDLGRRCDVMASADYKVVENLLMPAYADFNIRFAFNEMAIAYTDRSKLSREVSAENWHKILLADGVAFGRSDPDLDPCGYRTLMVFQLADKHYAIPGLAQKLEQEDEGRYVRPKETDLLALLETGEIDYLFIYRSVAKQHGLKMILLPDEVNLKSPELKELYNTVSVKVTGKKPGEFIERKGEPMVYSVTIPKNAPNPKAAAAWVRLLLSPPGRAIMQEKGQDCMPIPIADGSGELPDVLKELCK